MDGRLTPLQFPVAAPPRPGETLAAASGVWWLRMPLPFVLDHINLWLLEDGPGWTIVDTGYVKCRLGRHLVKQQSSIGFNAAAAVRGWCPLYAVVASDRVPIPVNTGRWRIDEKLSSRAQRLARARAYCCTKSTVWQRNSGRAV